MRKDIRYFKRKVVVNLVLSLGVRKYIIETSNVDPFGNTYTLAIKRRVTPIFQLIK